MENKGCDPEKWGLMQTAQQHKKTPSNYLLSVLLQMKLTPIRGLGASFLPMKDLRKVVKMKAKTQRHKEEKEVE